MFTAYAEYISSRGIARFIRSCVSLDDAIAAVNDCAQKARVLYSWIILPNKKRVILVLNGDEWTIPVQVSGMDAAQPGEEKRSEHPIQVKTISNSPYSAETRKKALELIAAIGISSTARKLGISTSTLSNWKIANGIEAGPIQPPNIQLPRVPPSHHYDEDTRRQALALVAEIGVCAAEKVLGISRRTLTLWRKAAGIPATGCAVRYSQETKQKAVEMIQRQGSPESERQTGISYDTLNKWRKEAGM